MTQTPQPDADTPTASDQALRTLIDFGAALVRAGQTGRAPGHVLIEATGAVTRSDNCLGPAVDAPGDASAVLLAAAGSETPMRIGQRELVAAASQLANALGHLGLRPGDGVALHLRPGRHAAIVAAACALGGWIAVPTDPALRPAALATCLQAGRCKLAVTSDDLDGGVGFEFCKQRLDAALGLPAARSVATVLVCRVAALPVPMQPPRDRWYHVVTAGQATEFEPEPSV